MTHTFILDTSLIEDAYRELEKFDPEVRNGNLIVQAGDSPEVRENKILRMKEYNKECEKFRNLCAERVALIHTYYDSHIESAFRCFPKNSIPETDTPLLSVDTYRKICEKIYLLNHITLERMVEGHYQEIYDEKKRGLIKKGFRFQAGNSEYPQPHIVIGWDTDIPITLRIKEDGTIESLYRVESGDIQSEIGEVGKKEGEEIGVNFFPGIGLIGGAR